MKSKNLVIYLILTVAGLLPVVKQARAQANFQTSGIVTDSITQNPLDYITVNLKTDKSAPIKAMLTKSDGSFRFSKIDPLKYIITLNAVGYQTKTINIDLSNGKNADVGSILLSRLAKNLKEIAITADKPIIKQEIDRISYDLQADPESKVSNVLEMLRKVPFVSLDGDDNILLKGNSSYKILINGKPSSMMERDPKTILRSIPASTIQRIEVITIPPAKYDAEGLAGIINIITNKKIDNGYNGTVNINDRYPGGPDIGTSFTIKEGKLGISGFGGANIRNSPTTENTTNRTTIGATPTTLVQLGSGSTTDKGGYFGTELSYEIDSLNLISAQFNLNGDKSTGNAKRNSLLSGAGSILQSYNMAVSNNGTGKGLDASLNYQLGFKDNKARLLTFSYRYYVYSNVNNTMLNISDPINFTTPDYNQSDNTTPSEQTFQIDYVQPLKKVNFEAGIKTIFRKNPSDFQYNSLNPITGQYDLVPALSNNFSSNQNIYAAYNTWQYRGKNWGVKAGVRIEQTLTDADFISTVSNVHQSYLDVIPSVAANWDFKDNSGINFGFTQRIKRPGINRLNPFVDRSNPDFQSSGNPNLQRTLINSMQFGYHFTKKATVNIGTTYDFGRGLDLPVSVFDPVTNITSTTYQNVGKVAAVGGFVNVNYPITSKLNFTYNSNLMHFWLTGIANGVIQTNNLFTLSMATSIGYTLNSGWRLYGEFDISGRNPTGIQGHSSGFTSSSFSVNKQIVKNKLSLSAAVRNPFTQYRISRTETNGSNFAQANINQVYFRSYSVSLNYNFGKLKDGIKKTKRGINNDDVSR
jgi:ferric enterobactin receptor